jgi:GNAT superfamily N-acetyltransferase
MRPVRLRALGSEDESLLRELIWLAVRWDEVRPPPRPPRLEPEVEGYVASFGGGADRGLLAHSGATPLGACWIRERGAGYGYVADGVGELTMAVFPDWRGCGIGRTLLHDVLKTEIGPLSLSVDPRNPALKLYEQFGFRRVGESGESWTMIRHPEL